ASTLLWVRDVEPVQFRHTRRVLAPKDYVRLMLTGEAVTDVTDASSTTLLDLRRRTWSREILDALEIPPAWLPDVQESPAISGGLRPSVAGELGLPARLPIAAGASGEAAAAIGCGIVEAGLISSSIRRDAVLFAPADHVIIDSTGRTDAGCHALPQRYRLRARTAAAGAALHWWGGVLGGHFTRDDLYQLAGVACGRYASVAEAVRHTAQPGKPVQPDPGRSAHYERLYRTFTTLAPAITGDVESSTRGVAQPG